MGIGQAFSRVKESVRKAGLDSVNGLSEQLRSAAIPAPLRPVATRLADLLRAPEGPSLSPLVSLKEAIDAQATHDELAAAGGVCPFSGMHAGMAGLLDPTQLEGAPGFEAATFAAASFEAPALEAVPSLEVSAHEAAESEEFALVSPEELVSIHPPDISKPAQASSITRKSRPVPRPTARKSAAPAPIVEPVAAATHESVRAKAVAQSKPAAADHSRTRKKATATPASKTVSPPKSKKSQALAEKDSEKVAARPASSKTPPRSKASTSKSASVTKPGAKRPIAKATNKKD